MHLDDRLPSKQARGLRRAQRESSKLLEHASVDGKILLGFQANAPAGAAHVNDSKPGRLRELEDCQRANAVPGLAAPGIQGPPRGRQSDRESRSTLAVGSWTVRGLPPLPAGWYMLYSFGIYTRRIHSVYSRKRGQRNSYASS